MIPLWMTVIGPGAILVRMRVQVIRPAVRRPARVGDTDRRIGGPAIERGPQIEELAGPLLDEERAEVVDERDPGRIVAAIFQPGQTLHQDGGRLARTRIADDSAHGILPLALP